MRADYTQRVDLLSRVPAAHRRAVRFLGVTVVTAGLGQALILLFFGGFDWPPLVANAVAVFLVGVVGFLLSLRFVWTESDETARGMQITVFMVMTLLGLVISSVTVRYVTQRLDHVLAANIGSFIGYGVAWLLRFAVLDRVVFRAAHV